MNILRQTGDLSRVIPPLTQNVARDMHQHLLIPLRDKVKENGWLNMVRSPRFYQISIDTLRGGFRKFGALGKDRQGAP